MGEIVKSRSSDQAIAVELHDDNALVIYTDGSCLQKPRRGGYAYRLVTVDSAGDDVTVDYSGPGFVGATNNEMELWACVEALKHLAGRRPPVPREAYEKVVVYTDSMYVYEGVPRAASVWPRSGWMTSEGEPVMSPDLWKELTRLRQQLGRVEFRKVTAHKSNPHNKAVDKLAKQSARQANREMISPPTARRKTSPRRTEARGIRMRGQTETIRIVARRNIRGRPHHLYKYEVVSKDSPDFEAVDDAFARDGKVELRPLHVYEVRLAEVGKGRWIEEVLRELDRE